MPDTEPTSDPSSDSSSDQQTSSPEVASDGSPQDAVDSVDGGGISLDQLSAAFAEMLRPSDEGSTAAEGEEQTEEPSAGVTARLEEGETEGDDVEVNPRNLLEAMLFVGNPEGTPLTSQQITGLIRGVSSRNIEQLVEQLNESYHADGSPFEIVSRGAGYQLTLREGFEPVRERFYGRIREARLSQAAIDVLAVVAYRGPVTADQVSQLRATPSRAILSQLVRRQLIRMERPKETPRSPIYRTTDRFLSLFNLTRLADLPRSETPVDG
jgi:segregation and condensation protein B